MPPSLSIRRTWKPGNQGEVQINQTVNMYLEFAISHGRTQQPQQPREFSEHEVNSGKKEQSNDERVMASAALH
jgi:hypothetical protein